MISNRLSKFYKDDCVYWEVTGMDGFGNPVFNPGVQLKVLWNTNEKLIVNDLGETIKPESVLFTSQKMGNGDYLFKGLLTDLTSTQLLEPKATGNRILATAESHSLLSVLDVLYEVYL